MPIPKLCSVQQLKYENDFLEKELRTALKNNGITCYMLFIKCYLSPINCGGTEKVYGTF